MTAALDPLAEARAIRERVAVARPDAVVALRLTGAGAFDATSAVSTAALHLGDAQMRPTLLLREDGSILADAYVCRDDEALWILSEGPSSAALVEHIQRHAPSRDLSITDVTASHGVLSVHGPYAWELVGEALDPDVVGMPFLSLYEVGAVTCFRAGKTGEYGYDLLVPRERFEEVEARVIAAGEALELGSVSNASVDLAALENGFFCVRHAPRVTSPFDRQLRWRIAFERSFVGAPSLYALASASTRRLVHALSTTRLEVDADLQVDGEVVGRVEHAERSALLSAGHADAWISLVSLDAAYAHPEVDLTETRSGAALRTVAPPVLDNRSLYVSPQRHAFASRASDAFPPLVRP